jgi:hypothetical protein
MLAGKTFEGLKCLDFRLLILSYIFLAFKSPLPPSFCTNYVFICPTSIILEAATRPVPVPFAIFLKKKYICMFDQIFLTLNTEASEHTNLEHVHCNVVMLKCYDSQK